MAENIKQPIYHEFEPPQYLKHSIANYWKFSIPKREESLYHIIPPDGCISLTFTINQYLPVPLVEFSGAGFEMKEVEIPSETTFIGIRFQPGAFNLYFPHSIDDIKFKFVDASSDIELFSLAKMMTHDFSDFEVFNQFLLSRESREIDQRVSQAVQTIIRHKGNISIKEIHQSIPLTERHFQRLFKKLTGVSAQELNKLMKIRHALIDLVLDQSKLGEIAYEHGFYDQSHFNRELLKLAQKSPSQMKKYYQSIKMQAINW